MTKQFVSKDKTTNLAPDDAANFYIEKYPQYMNIFESKNAKSRVKESVSAFDIIGMGRQLDSFNDYRRFCESQSNLSSLGVIPEIALDVITSVGTLSVIPLLASTQPLAEEHGVVYFKQRTAGSTGNGYTIGDVIADPRSLDNVSRDTAGFGSNQTTIEIPTVAATLTYTGTLATKLRPYKVNILSSVSGAIQDNGKGKLIGYGVQGEINYETGAYTIVFKEDPGAGVLSAIIDRDVDAQEDLESIRNRLDSKEIRARIWALKTDVGAFANFAFANRFKRNPSDETAQDLTDELVRTMNTAAVEELIKAIIPLDPAKVPTWKTTPSAGVGAADHKTGFIDTLATAERILHEQSGVNTINRIVAGIDAAQAIRGMPSFVPDTSAAVNSVGLYGYLDGVPVIRASHVLDDKQAVVLGNAGGYFNAPLVHAPYMPLMITSTVQSPNNPFRSTQAAGIWAGLTAVNPNLATYINFTA